MCKGLATLPATCLRGAKEIKHKISFLLQKPEVQSADQKQSREVKEREDSAEVKSVPDPVEVEKWKQSFSNLMSSDTGRCIFSAFLKSEFSEENLDFWESCEDFRRSSPTRRRSRAQQIYQRYVEVDAPNQVNLDSETRAETLQNLQGSDPLCFHRAQRSIFALMEKDSYRRFLRSPVLQDPQPPAPEAPGHNGRKTLTVGA